MGAGGNTDASRLPDKYNLIKRLFMLGNQVLPVPRREKRQAEMRVPLKCSHALAPQLFITVLVAETHCFTSS